NDITFSWTQVDGTGTPVTTDAVTLIPVTPDNKQMSFTAPGVGVTGGVIYFKLTVTDIHGASNSNTVEIDITYVNRPPMANAGNDQNVNEGATVSLSGSASDPDNNPLTLTWSQV